MIQEKNSRSPDLGGVDTQINQFLLPGVSTVFSLFSNGSELIFDTLLAAQAFLHNHVYGHSYRLSISRTCPAVEAAICHLPSPSVANAAVESYNSSPAKNLTGRASAEDTIAEARSATAVISPAPVVMRPMLFETVSLGREEPENLMSSVESRVSLSRGSTSQETSADMKAISLNLPDGMTGRGLETGESGYEGDDEDGDDNDDARSCSLSTDGVLLNSNDEKMKTQEREKGDREEEGILTLSVADMEIGGRLRTIAFVGGNDENNANDARFVSSNRFTALFESSDDEEEKEEQEYRETISLAGGAIGGELRTSFDDADDDNKVENANDARYVSKKRFAALFESSEEDEHEEQEEKQEREDEWGEKWGKEWNKEDDGEHEEEETKEEREAKKMEFEDDESQEMEEMWREMDEEWEELEEWVE